MEYADTDQDEAELQKKIEELLGAGTKHVWVVRLVGPRRVEIHEKGRAMRTALPGEDLTAPGILKNSVPVLALYDREAAHDAMLRNLLQRRGYESLDAVRAEAHAQGKLKSKLEGEIKALQDALFAVLGSRGLAVSEGERAQIAASRDPGALAAWVARAATAGTAADALASPKAEPWKRRRK
jgi:hypothetical protein